MSKYCENRGCLKLAQQICARCSVAGYCSKKCQVQAFALHSKHCFELPGLIDISDSLVGTLMQNNADSSFDANTSVIGSNVYKPPQSVVGSSRGANDEKAKASRSVAPAFNQGPRSVAPVTYKEPKKTVPTEPTQFVVDEMKQEAPKPEVEKVVVEEPKKAAPTLPMSLNKLRLHHQKLAPPQQPVKVECKRVLVGDLKIRPLPKGSFKAIGLTGDLPSKILYVVEFVPEVTTYLETIESGITEFVKAQKATSYKPTKNEVVLALYEERFYRAVCRASTKIGDIRHYSVQFLDYGDVAQVTEESIRPFDESLMFEIVTHACKILNMPSNEEELAKIVGAEYLQLKDAKESDEEGVSYTANFNL